MDTKIMIVCLILNFDLGFPTSNNEGIAYQINKFEQVTSLNSIVSSMNNEVNE